MKDLKAFMAKVSEDQDLAKKVMAAKDTAEVVSIAAAAGYKFTEDDLMDEQMSQVAGGFSLRGALDKATSAANSLTNTVNSTAGAVTGAIGAGTGAANAVADGVDRVADTGRQAAGNIFNQLMQ